jgi:hypothetical protein
VILDIKCYIFNPIPSKPTSPELAIASYAIDHQMGSNIGSNREELH